MLVANFFWESFLVIDKYRYCTVQVNVWVVYLCASCSWEAAGN